MTRLSLILTAIAAIGLAAGAWFWSREDDRFAACSESSVAGGAGSIGGSFELVSETGETVTEAELLDQPALVYFGYTFCPDVCPPDAARNAEAVAMLEEQGHDVTPVFVTVDPARDTPEVLAEWTDYIHPEMVGLSGSEDQIRQAASAYKVYYARAEGSDPEYYLMNHTNFTYLMLPEAGFVDFFRGATEVTADDIAETASCYLDRA